MLVIFNDQEDIERFRLRERLSLILYEGPGSVLEKSNYQTSLENGEPHSQPKVVQSQDKRIHSNTVTHVYKNKL
jgi:hypothetical protein